MKKASTTNQEFGKGLLNLYNFVDDFDKRSLSNQERFLLSNFERIVKTNKDGCSKMNEILKKVFLLLKNTKALKNSKKQALHKKFDFLDDDKNGILEVINEEDFKKNTLEDWFGRNGRLDFDEFHNLMSATKLVALYCF